MNKLILLIIGIAILSFIFLPNLIYPETIQTFDIPRVELFGGIN